jgi:amino acid adenylation domain-containing protein
LNLSFSKRYSDAPSIRFLPSGDFGLNPEREKDTLATHHTSAQVLRSLQRLALEIDCSLENLLLAGFASLLLRLTRQGNMSIVVEPSQLANFHLEEDCSFRSVANQAGNRTEHQPDGSQPSEHGIRYQFLTGSQLLSDSEGFPLRFTARENGTILELSSPEGIWRQETLQSWLGYLLTLIGNAAENRDLPVDRLPMWDDAEARRRYALLNQTSVEFPGEPFVHRRFTLQARSSPDATAVTSENLRYTYRELDQRSDEVARQLIAAGACPGRAVAVCMERTAHMPMALLAVLKSGACYVPLDPHNPTERLRGILEECNPAVLLSDSLIADTLKSAFGLDSLPILCADLSENENQTGKSGGSQLQALPPSSRLPGQSIDPDSLAYIIYTSGSTGIPKGVPITHRALMNLICSMWRCPGATPADRTLAVAPISFDIATMDMFLPICSGGTLVIASRKDAVDPYRLAQLIREHDITCMQATPATWRMLVTSGWAGKRNLKMITGGEALPRQLANDLLARGGELWNCYGPTETAIYSGFSRFDPKTASSPSALPSPIRPSTLSIRPDILSRPASRGNSISAVSASAPAISPAPN